MGWTVWLSPRLRLSRYDEDAMNILVLNSGSSSLKFQVIDTDLETIEKKADRTLARGMLERIGSEALVKTPAGGKPPPA